VVVVSIVVLVVLVVVVMVMMVVVVLHPRQMLVHPAVRMFRDSQDRI
jgi:hypothetical protein